MKQPRNALSCWLAAALLFVVSQDARAGGIVSLNLCSDQLLVELAARPQIAAVSFLARDPTLSYVARRARRLPAVQASAEQVLALHPDLVLAGVYGARPALALIKDRGIPVLQLAMAKDFPAIRRETLHVGRRLGRLAQARRQLARMDRLLRASRAAPDAMKPRGLVLEPGGFTPGRGSLADAVLKAAGWINLAATAGIDGYGYLSLEKVLTLHPDVLISEHTDADYPSLAGQWLHHPALSALPRVYVPGALLACGGPQTAIAVAELAGVRRALAARQP